MEKYISTPKLFAFLAAILLAAFMPTQNAESYPPCPNKYCWWGDSSCRDANPEDNSMCIEVTGSPEDCSGTTSCPNPH